MKVINILDYVSKEEKEKDIIDITEALEKCFVELNKEKPHQLR